MYPNLMIKSIIPINIERYLSGEKLRIERDPYL